MQNRPYMMDGTAAVCSNLTRMVLGDACCIFSRFCPVFCSQALNVTKTNKYNINHRIYHNRLSHFSSVIQCSECTLVLEPGSQLTLGEPLCIHPAPCTAQKIAKVILPRSRFKTTPVLIIRRY